jgi:hypothetical protein
MLNVYQPQGMVSSPKAIDFPKQRVRQGICSNSFLPVFMLINPITFVGVLSLLYYAQDLVIQIDINKKSIPHAYDCQT